jgi:hypothetical protein
MASRERVRVSDLCLAGLTATKREARREEPRSSSAVNRPTYATAALKLGVSRVDDLLGFLGSNVAGHHLHRRRAARHPENGRGLEKPLFPTCDGDRSYEDHSRNSGCIRSHRS